MASGYYGKRFTAHAAIFPSRGVRCVNATGKGVIVLDGSIVVSKSVHATYRPRTLLGVFTTTPLFRRLFDMLADMETVGAQKMAAGELSSSHHQEELPWLDTYRNFLRSPPIEFRAQYEVFQSGFRAA